MGDQGTLFISESSSRGGIYREPSSPDWEKWVKAGIITEPVAEKKPEKTEDSGSLLDVRETEAPPAYGINATMDKKYHQPHLENSLMLFVVKLLSIVPLKLVLRVQ